MPDYRALAEAEPWTTTNVLASVVLLVLVIAGLIWLVRRFLIN